MQGHYAYLYKDIMPICTRTLRLFVQGHYAYLYKDITHICTRTLCPFLSGGFLDSQKRHFRIRLSSGFRLALNDIFAVLEFYAMYIGSSIRTFRNNVSFRSSRTKHLCNLDHCWERKLKLTITTVFPKQQLKQILIGPVRKISTAKLYPLETDMNDCTK